tara:strand:+ start:239 stop:841 length:603 start_codon:yes stop_codon:yes gene_type:complete
MPCPPSLEERKSHECYYKQKRANKSNQQLVDVQTLLRTIDNIHGEHIGLRAEILPMLTIKGVNIGKEPSPKYEDFDSPEFKIVVEKFWNWVRNVEEEEHRMEEEACRASTLLVLVWDRLLEQGIDCSRWEQEYFCLAEYHRKHREEDRQWLLKELNREMESIQKGSDKRTRLSQMEKAIQAVDIEILIRDREALMKLRRI